MATPSLPSYARRRADDDRMDERLRGLLEATHRQWNSPDERRRMRAFGFRPAVEPGVLKREWHGLAVRVSAGGMRAARPGAGELAWIAGDRGPCSSTASPTPAAARASPWSRTCST